MEKCVFHPLGHFETLLKYRFSGVGLTGQFGMKVETLLRIPGFMALSVLPDLAICRYLGDLSSFGRLFDVHVDKNDGPKWTKKF